MTRRDVRIALHGGAGEWVRSHSMFKPAAILSAAVGYLRKNPDEVVTAATNATGLKFGVPLASLRWLAGQLDALRADRVVADYKLEALVTREEAIAACALADVVLSSIQLGRQPMSSIDVPG